MIRTGRVVAAEGDSLRVCFDRPEMCASCGKCGVHGVHQELVTVEGKASAGNWVQVEMPDAQVVKVSLIAYVIPLAGLMIGLVIGQNVLGTDLWAAVLGIALLGAGLLAVRLLDRHLGRKPNWKPRLVKVMEEMPHPLNEEQT